jgi:hypothetical protein
MLNVHGCGNAYNDWWFQKTTPLKVLTMTGSKSEEDGRVGRDDAD